MLKFATPDADALIASRKPQTNSTCKMRRLGKIQMKIVLQSYHINYEIAVIELLQS